MEAPTWLVLYMNSDRFILTECFPFFSSLHQASEDEYPSDGLKPQHSGRGLQSFRAPQCLSNAGSRNSSGLRILHYYSALSTQNVWILDGMPVGRNTGAFLKLFARDARGPLSVSPLMAHGHKSFVRCCCVSPSTT